MKDNRIIDLDEFGKCLKAEFNKIVINNTKSQNQLVFKLCVDNAISVANSNKS